MSDQVIYKTVIHVNIRPVKHVEARLQVAVLGDLDPHPDAGREHRHVHPVGRVAQLEGLGEAPDPLEAPTLLVSSLYRPVGQAGQDVLAPLEAGLIPHDGHVPGHVVQLRRLPEAGLGPHRGLPHGLLVRRVQEHAAHVLALPYTRVYYSRLFHRPAV